MPNRELLRPNRGVREALKLAEMQGEAASLRASLALVKQYESKLANASVHTAKAIPVTERDVVFKATSYKPFSRTKLAVLIGQLVFKIQACLKRYVLMKRARACFSLPCSKEDFIRLFRGHVDITGSGKSQRLYVSMTGASTQAVTKKLSIVLDVDCEKSPWFVRRYYGRHVGRTRDCAFVKIDQNHNQRKEILFFHSRKTIYQLDRLGVARESSMEYLCVRIPRHCVPVKPTNAAKEAYLESQRAKKLELHQKRTKSRAKLTNKLGKFDLLRAYAHVSSESGRMLIFVCYCVLSGNMTAGDAPTLSKRARTMTLPCDA